MTDEIKFDAILNIEDPDFGQKLTEALQVITPQFDRTDGRVVPLPAFDFSKLPELSDETLREIGCQIWNESARGTHWLFPAEWYDHIPAGTPIVTINDVDELFKPGETDNDTRFGALAYGFIKPGGRDE